MADDLPPREPVPGDAPEPLPSDEYRTLEQCALAPDDLALVSLAAGILGLILTMGQGSALITLALPLIGATAVVCGWQALRHLRNNASREPVALAGLALGVLTLAIWILGRVVRW
ncbi:MAG TPA: hypothetical protein DCZ72_12590 [Armatimonadetes bacterium]|nr:hypothetical protein [Armatimonadota bacterium]